MLAIADEDLERENDEKTSSVHFLRFELSPQMCAQVKAGAAIGVGIDHDNYRHAVASRCRRPCAIRWRKISAEPSIALRTRRIASDVLASARRMYSCDAC